MIKCIALVLCVLTLASCREQQPQEELRRQNVEIARLKTQLDDCRTKSEGTNQSKAVIAETVRELESMLKDLAAQNGEQDLLRTQARELTVDLEDNPDPSVSQRDLLRSLVEQIAENQRELMRYAESTNQKLAEAHRQLASAGRDAKATYERRLEKAQKTILMYAEANKKLSDELGEANKALRNANGRIVELEDLVKATEILKQQVKAEADQLTAARLAGHWTVGRKSDLTKRGVLRRANRFSRAFCPRCSNCSSCATLNVSDGLELLIDAPADRVEVMTEHPDDSFSIEPRGHGKSAVVIRRAEIFWNYGQCLIVATN
jgi:DNA repair exonuclease SbcCD ATPase subunit